VQGPWNTGAQRGYAAKARNGERGANYDDLPESQKERPEKGGAGDAGAVDVSSGGARGGLSPLAGAGGPAVVCNL